VSEDAFTNSETIRRKIGICSCRTETIIDYVKKVPVEDEQIQITEDDYCSRLVVHSQSRPIQWRIQKSGMTLYCSLLRFICPAISHERSRVYPYLSDAARPPVGTGKMPNEANYNSQIALVSCSFLISHVRVVGSALLDWLTSIIDGTYRCTYYTSVLGNRCPEFNDLGLLSSILERGEAGFYHVNFLRVHTGARAGEGTEDDSE